MKTIHDRFMGNVSPEPNSGCWLWDGCVLNNGYGQMSIKGKGVSAHRISWQLYKGPIPKGRGHHGTCVLHKCDVTLCVNPDHLFLGTPQDNMTDKVNKGRCPIGETHGRAKLSNQDVLEIRKALASGVKQRVIAQEYAVSTQTINSINTGTNWGWL